MKVLEINSVCGIRSTGRICTDLADVLREHGHDCRIAYGRETVPERYEDLAVRIGSDFDVKKHGLLSRLFGRTGFYSKAVTRRFLKWVDEYKPDLIHLHNIHGYYIHVGELFSYIQKRQIPVVWTLHDCWAFTGHCAYYAAIECHQWETRCTQCALVRGYPACWGWENTAKNFDTKKRVFTAFRDMVFVTPSHWLAEQVKRSYFGGYPIEVVYNGIDLSVFQPTAGDFREKYKLEEKTIVLGVASDWSKRKGLDDFIRLSEMLPENHKIVLVGLAQKQIESLPSRILGIHRTDSTQELAEIYTAADVFVNPSREETMGLVTVEALACGTPCVVYDATAVPEVMDETCGQVVPVGDVEALAQAIHAVLNDSGYTAEKCLHRAKEYEKTAQFSRYLELYKKIYQNRQTAVEER